MTKRKPNPRPRKYASASERQAAYRARAPEVCFRADEKTAQTLDRIAADLDVSRADLLLSMTKFALTNHDWARFGLTHKPLPFGYGTQDETRKENPVKMTKRQEVIEFGKRMGFKASAGKGYVYLTNMVGWGETFDDWDKAHAYVLKAYDDHYVHRTPYPWDYKENPTMKTPTKRKPTPAQLAARERFAEMARSGAFKKARAKKRTTTRKANPIGDLPKLKKRYQTVLLTMADLRDDQKRRKQGLPDEMPGYTDAEIANLIARYQAKAQDLRDAIAMYEGAKTNPRKPTVSRKISQLVHEGYPQRQAVAVALSEERAGKVRRNPTAAKLYTVSRADALGKPVYHIAHFRKLAEAKQYAQAYADTNKTRVAITSKAL